MESKKIEFDNPRVADVFMNYPEKLQTKLLALRQMIFETAAATNGVGKLQETLKWGQPSYLTPKTKSGSTVRIDSIKNNPEKYAMYFHCQTMLVETFREMYPTKFKFEGYRAIIFSIEDQIPEQELSHCISMALTYHLNKKMSS
ncbi:MAG: DUF1801 domain-containing protein [Calditrichaeota bacterium]|nr:MAG: DUF1801 domain-containing protein [Calditrichota bacterium]MBL1207633.1 DUF1801 domain-containing protein [Calditrichota bacterium]NOG47466.1 DUF1801 domain-containing protein [Calditrichota bacterium]